MIRLTQRQINHGVFGLMTGVAASVGGLLLTSPTTSIVGVLSIGAYILACAVLWAAYWRGWEIARPMLIALLTLILAFSVTQMDETLTFNHMIYAVPVLALVLTGPGWVLGSALVLLAAFASHAKGGPYANPIDLLIFMVTIGGMVLSRLASDNVQHLTAAKREADAARAQAEQRERELAAQATELAQRNQEQQQLLELVTSLETPTIAVADGVLLAPIVGALDSRRAHTLTSRLLNEVSAHRVRRVILDISGVTAVDTQVAQALLRTVQALGLLGCQVILTGISAEVATTLTHLGVDLGSVAVMRSPQDALAHA